MHPRIAALLTSLTIASFASAQPQEPWVSVTVWRSDAGGCSGGQESIRYLDPGEAATINLSTCADRVNIVTSPISTVNIGRLTFTGGPGNFPVDIVLGEGGIRQSDNPGTPVGRDLDGIDTGWLNESRFAGAINGSLVGQIDVHHMYRFDALGDIRAGIKVDSPYPGGFVAVNAASISPSGWVEVESGHLKRVQTNNDIRGSIIAAHGAITQGVIAGGDIGAPGSPVTIRAGYGNIGRVVAEDIFANITAVQGTQYSGYLERLEATNGQFIGTIVAYELRNNNEVSQFSCVGDMEATITMTGGNLSDPLIITGGDFHADSVLTSNKLADHDGAITITAVNGGTVGGHLFGDMYFDTFTDVGRDIYLENGLCGLLRLGEDLRGAITIDGTPGQPNEGLTGQVIIKANNTTGT